MIVFALIMLAVTILLSGFIAGAFAILKIGKEMENEDFNFHRREFRRDDH